MVMALEANHTPGYSGISYINEMPGVLGRRFLYPPEKETRLMYCYFLTEDLDEIKIHIKDYFSAMVQQGCDIERMRMEALWFLTGFLRKLADMGADLHQVCTRGVSEILNEVIQCQTREDLEIILLAVLLKSHELVRENRSRHSSPIVIHANRYLDAHFVDDDLSLDVMADFLKVNPSYFSRLYKKETGQGFVERITYLRLEKAKTLLAATDIKIVDIAQMVGYQHARYFWNIFKKHCGCSPTEYRECWRATIANTLNV